MEVIIIGGGVVACLIGIELRERKIAVRLYANRQDPRIVQENEENPSNLILTKRGQQSLSPVMAKSMLEISVYLGSMVVKQMDTVPDRDHQPCTEQTMSTSKSELHQLLLNKAEELGAVLFFDHDCIAADTYRGTVRMAVKVVQNYVEDKGEFVTARTTMIQTN